MGYHEEYEARMKKIRDELDQIIDQNPNGKEMLDKRFLKNFGCINGFSAEVRHEFMLACEYHRRMKEAHPEEHEMHEYEPYRCYHELRCKCGFGEDYDSSD